MPAAAAEPLTPERILEATEEVLRRYGPAKATVVDVARALGVSHGSVYRHFPTKAALREAVTRALAGPTSVAAGRDRGRRRARPPSGWTAGSTACSRPSATRRVTTRSCSPRTVLLGENSAVVDQHLTELMEQLSRIIEDGRAAGRSSRADGAGCAARAVFDATGRFHDPPYAADWSRPGIEDAFEAVTALVLRGLRA